MVRGRLWRRANPHLSEADRRIDVAALMRARRAIRDAEGAETRAVARAAVNAAKVALGERGPVWWDGGEDLNRHLARNTRYADWYAALDGEP